MGGAITGRSYVGALVGNKASGNVTNAFASAAVNGFSYVGGLIGLSNGGNTHNSYATGAVRGTSTLVGGLIGQARFFGSITNSYATGVVNGSGASYVGGLVGQLRFVTVTNAYAMGAVSGSFGVGGLVGLLDQTTITKSYAMGAVSGSGSLGGLVGSSSGGTVTNSYWNTQTSGRATSAGGGRGMTSAQMQAQANFTSATAANGNVNPAWDFASTWLMYEGQTAPFLRSLMKPLTVTANNAGKTYDALAYSGGNGVIYSTSTNGLIGSVGYSGTSQGATNAGSYVITPNGLPYQQGYLVSYANGALDVAPKALTATLATPNKIYDGNVTAAPTLSIIAGLVGSETVSATGTASFNSRDVLTANLVTVDSTALANGTNGGLASNYTLAAGQTVAATITPKALTVSGITAANKLFDGTTAATVNAAAATLNGLVAGDAVNVSATGVFADKDAGSGKTVSLTTSYAGAHVRNYGITDQAVTTADITPAPLAQTPAPATPPSVLNVTTQLQSSVVPLAVGIQAQGLSLSPTITVTQSSGISAGADASSRSRAGEVVNTTMSIGGSGSSLQIINGGMKLPDATVNAQR